MSRFCLLMDVSIVSVALAALGLLPGTAPSPSSPASEPAAPAVASGPTGDGKTDDTAALQRLIDRSGDLRLRRGVYRITQPIVIDLDKVGPVSLAGGGTARIVMAGPGPAIRLVGTHQGTADPSSVRPNVWQNQRTPTVEGLEIVGDHPEAGGIEAVGTMQLTITRLTVREALHGIHLVKRNRNVIVAGCHLYNNRGTGLYLDDVDLHQINVSGCHISYNRAGGIVCRAGCVRNLQISGCDIEANRFNVLLDSRGGACGTAEVAIVGCTLQHAGGDDSANVRFIGADKEGRRAWGHLTIADNVLSDVQVNVDIQQARGVSIQGNTFGTGYRHNLRIEDSSNVVVGPNVFERNPKYRDEKTADNALLVRRCEDITLTGLHVNGVRRAEAGVVLEDCRRVNLTGCSILDCDRAGLILRNVSHSRVSDCLLRDDRPEAGDAAVALKVSGGRGNMIVDNLARGRIVVDPESAHSAGNVGGSGQETAQKHQ